MSGENCRNLHGHELMNWMLPKGRMSQEAFWSEARALFGGTSFHTCSAEGMTLEQLVDFLAAKGKIVRDETTIQLLVPACNH